jgi:Type ISP C-terminal specificity domain
MDHFCNRGAKDTIPLWRNSEGTEANVNSHVLQILTGCFGRQVAAEDLFAYCFGILANPGFAAKFFVELADQELRVPITKDRELFEKIREKGELLIFLQTFGERMARPHFTAETRQGMARCLTAIEVRPDAYPNDFSYDESTQELRIGDGIFSVAPEVWNFSISNFRVLRSWLGYRMSTRRGRRSSPLDDVRPACWDAAMTRELLDLVWAIENTVREQAALDDLLEEVIHRPVFEATDFPQPTEEERSGRAHSPLFGL